MMFSRFKFLSLLLITGLISSCSALDSYLATPPPSLPTETALPTPTFAWFAASATPTLQFFSTQIPTPEMRPGLGDIVVTDTFTQRSFWDTATSDQASAEIEDNRLNLSVKSGIYMISLRQELVVNDFYAEITARPGLCRGDDSYGFLVRANAVAYYRFSLSCTGTVSAERISVGTRQILQEPLPSGDVPPGAPGEVRIGVWASGTEMRLFLNGRYQFTITDSNYASGTVGVFVNSAGNNAAVVSFSKLVVQNIVYNPPPQTPQP